MLLANQTFSVYEKSINVISPIFVFGSPVVSAAVVESAVNDGDAGAAAGVGCGTHALLSTGCVAAARGRCGRDCGGSVFCLPLLLLFFFFFPLLFFFFFPGAS